MPTDTPTPVPPPPTSEPARSPLGELLIPLTLIAITGVVFGVFYTLNQGKMKDDPTPTTSGASA